MFEKLRKNFVRMNMLVITLLMVAAFLVVYALTYGSAQKEINDELSRLLAKTELVAAEEPLLQLEPQQFDVMQEKQYSYANIPRIGFVVLHFEGGGHEVVGEKPFFNTEEFDIEGMLARVAAQNKNAGSFTLDGHTWTYRAVAMENGGQRVAFVETSESRALLVSLVQVFAAVTVVLLVVIWLVSRWFARRSVKPIEEAYNNQRRFVQDASHELKTPVAVFKTNLELLASHPKESVESQKEWVENMMTETAHMERLTAGLLSLARTEAPQQQAEKVRFSLSQVVENTVLPMEAALYEKHIAFVQDVQADVFVEGGQDDVERLLHILMENAIQYTPQKGEIGLTLKAEKHKAVLCVSNTGEGIPVEDLPHVFDRFYRGDASRNRQSGYGLGLAIAKGIVERQKGSISVESEEGKMTWFTVVLPLV